MNITSEADAPSARPSSVLPDTTGPEIREFLAFKLVDLVVDGVSDVMTVTPSQLRPAPSFAAIIDSDHLLAIGSLENRTLMLLDIEKLMAGADMGLISQTVH
jgi:chemotaxis signal transduction protein